MKKTLLFSALLLSAYAHAHTPLVLQTDFGVKDGAVAAMKGVANQVDTQLSIYDLTHEIPAYDIWQAAYRLHQTAQYWPAGTVFVSVVDPGVGTTRKSIVLKTKNGQYFVSPDNGTLTLIAQTLGIEAVREIDEQTNRLAGSEKSYTFHGRDVYAYTGARLAAGVIDFEQVGNVLESEIVQLPYTQAAIENDALIGTIPALDVQYGNVWTNIPDALLQTRNIAVGDTVCVSIFKQNEVRYKGLMPYANSFGDVAEGAALMYLNSLLNVSFALNMDNFAEKNDIAAGNQWRVEIADAKLCK